MSGDVQGLPPGYYELSGADRQNAVDILHAVMALGNQHGVTVEPEWDMTPEGENGIALRVTVDRLSFTILVMGWRPEFRQAVREVVRRTNAVYNADSSAHTLAEMATTRKGLDELKDPRERHALRAGLVDDFTIVDRECKANLDGCNDLRNWRGAVPSTAAIIFGEAVNAKP